MRTLFLSVVCLFLLSCSKQDDLKIDDISLVKNTQSIQKTVAVPSCIECGDKKWGERACGDSFHVGTACDIIGSTCRYHTCNAGAQSKIIRALSEKEIDEYAKQYADEQVKTGFIQKEKEGITIAIMKSALKSNNNRFK
jgi:hypothetical protein